MFLVNSRYPHFSATSIGFERVARHLHLAHLLPKLRWHFAEFLREASLKRLGMLFPPTCVGLRYGHHRDLPAGAFLGSLGSLSSWVLSTLLITSRDHAPPFVPERVLEELPTGLNRANRASDQLPFSVPPATIIRGGTGILTCFPSPTPFGVGLGTD